MILLTLVSVVAYLVMPGGNKPAAKNENAAEIQPKDDLELFVLKYGKPDRVESTENDKPRPPIVTRFLVYEPEHVRAMYYPLANVGDPPPYDKWKLVGFEDTRDDQVLKPDVVVERLKKRLRQK